MGWGVTTIHTFVILKLCCPLVDELYPLWKNGSMTFDDSSEISSKAVLPMTVFMGYMLSGIVEYLSI